jgi:hypothetical protein
VADAGAAGVEGKGYLRLHRTSQMLFQVGDDEAGRKTTAWSERTGELGSAGEVDNAEGQFPWTVPACSN